MVTTYQRTGHEGPSVGWRQEAKAGKHCKYTRHRQSVNHTHTTPITTPTTSDTSKPHTHRTNSQQEDACTHSPAHTRVINLLVHVTACALIPDLGILNNWSEISWKTTRVHYFIWQMESKTFALWPYHNCFILRIYPHSVSTHSLFLLQWTNTLSSSFSEHSLFLLQWTFPIFLLQWTNTLSAYFSEQRLSSTFSEHLTGFIQVYSLTNPRLFHDFSRVLSMTHANHAIIALKT